MTNERRGRPRADVSWQIRWNSSSGNPIARISDLSLLGCYIATYTHADVGESIDFEVKLDSGEWFPLRGTVAVTEPHIGFSLKFGELNQRETEEISGLMKQQPPKDDPALLPTLEGYER